MTLRVRTLSALLSAFFLLILAMMTAMAMCQATGTLTTASGGTPPYKDPSLPIADRVKDLLSRMTLEEKVEQLHWGWLQKADVVDPTGTYTTESARKTLRS